MTIDEYAEYEKKNGTPIIKVGNVWWRSIRPFFYRTLHPFQLIDINDFTNKPRLSLCRQYAVINKENSYINYLVYRDIDGYSIDKIKHDRRYNIKRGLKVFNVEILKNHEKYVDQAYRVYMDFYQRTHYEWMKKRIFFKNFHDWISNVMKNQKVTIHGLLHNGSLEFISISYLVEDVLMMGAFIATTVGLKAKGYDVITHIIREEAAKSKRIKLIYFGKLSGEGGIDKAKVERGCEVISVPARLEVNSLILFLVKKLRYSLYKKIVGYDSTEMISWLKLKPQEFKIDFSSSRLNSSLSDAYRVDLN